MKEISEEQKIARINAMSHEEMCDLWRNAPTGHEYFDTHKPYAKVFVERLFNHFGGFNPEISKKV
jgi:hypothetical protein